MPRLPHGLSRYDQLIKANLEAPAPSTPFPSTLGRLYPANPVFIQNLTHTRLIEIFEELTDSMGATGLLDGPAAAGMTFLGQFIDHDVTLDATSALGTRIVPATIPNIRTPSLDLDCVYGAGPEASPHLYGGAGLEHFLLYGTAANPHDLARTSNGVALIGDPRNDENHLVSQVQGAFIALHNILMTKFTNEGGTRAEIHDCAQMGMSHTDWHAHVHPSNLSFEEVRRFVRLHYQWVIWNEFLPAFVDQSCLDEARIHDLFGADAAIMPVEFTGAAYRFGHATTQPSYALTAGDVRDMHTLLGFGARPQADNIDFAQFFDIDGATAPKARPVGPSLGEPLLRLPFVTEEMELADIGVTISVQQSKSLPLRNTLRDRYTYQLVNGEHIAADLNARHGSNLAVPDVHPTLATNGITKTPLWFYCLREAGEGGTQKLTGVGGALVASVFARLLRLDPTTYWHAHGFQPWHGFHNPSGVLGGIMKFVETHRDSVAHADQLKNG
ncbi:MAG: peroxidase family protein [Pseudomonadota bacterium]